MSSAHSRAFATIAQPEHLREYRSNSNAYSNAAMRAFVQTVVGTRFIADHVVIARHEDVLRKSVELEAAYWHCVHPSSRADHAGERHPGRRLQALAHPPDSTSVSTLPDELQSRNGGSSLHQLYWTRHRGHNLQRMPESKGNRCLTRFSDLVAAQEACERAARCGGVVCDSGLACGNSFTRFELRSVRTQEEHAAATTAWLLHRSLYAGSAG